MGGVESDYSVCPRPFLQFLQFCQFKLVRLHQLTSGYVRLRQVTSDYVSLRWRDGTWTSTILALYSVILKLCTVWSLLAFSKLLANLIKSANLLKYISKIIQIILRDP